MIVTRCFHGVFKFNGGDGEIRTLERLPFTRFPGVLLQPLGHVTYINFYDCYSVYLHFKRPAEHARRDIHLGSHSDTSPI